MPELVQYSYMAPPTQLLKYASLACLTQVLGGGGGFLQVEVKVSPGEMLEVLVGGGGEASHGEVGGAGGFNGGQAGGRCHEIGTESHIHQNCLVCVTPGKIITTTRIIPAEVAVPLPSQLRGVLY